MQLPIDVIPNSNPPRFKWSQVVETINGRQVVECEGGLPSSVEKSVADLIAMTKTLKEENRQLQERLDEANRKANAAQTLNSNQRQMLDQAAREKEESQRKQNQQSQPTKKR